MRMPHLACGSMVLSILCECFFALRGEKTLTNDSIAIRLITEPARSRGRPCGAVLNGSICLRTAVVVLHPTKKVESHPRPRPHSTTRVPAPISRRAAGAGDWSLTVAQSDRAGQGGACHDGRQSARAGTARYYAASRRARQG